jgi:hypothetical protein
MKRHLRTLALGLAASCLGLAATAGAASAATVLTVNPKAGLSATGSTTITVTGTGYDATTEFPAPGSGVERGIYVAYGPKTASFATDASVYQTVKWVAPDQAEDATHAPMGTDGSFSTTLTIDPTYTTGSGPSAQSFDCRVTQCYVLTMAAHGSSDRTQDRFQPLVFDVDPMTPQISIAPATTGLDGVNEVELSLTGTGFDPNTANGIGFYVAFGPKNDADFWTNTAPYYSAKYIRPGATPAASGDNLNPDGSWSTTLKVRATYTKSGTTYDCAVVACKVLTFAAQGNADRTLDTTTPIGFAGSGSNPGGGGGGSTPGTPTLAASPTTGLSATGPTTIGVTGSGFDANAELFGHRRGVYLVYGPRPADFRTNANGYGAVKWVRPGGTASESGDAMSSTGGFATTLTVNPTYADGAGNTVDCTVTQCYLMTMAAHGDPDASQDTVVALSFAGQAMANPTPPAGDALPGPVASQATSVQGAGRGPAATIALADLAVVQRKGGRVTLRVSGPGTVSIDVRRKVAKRSKSGKLVVRWAKVKTIKVTTTKAGTVSRSLGLKSAGRYRIAVSARGRDGKLTRTRARVLTVKTQR